MGKGGLMLNMKKAKIMSTIMFTECRVDSKKKSEVVDSFVLRIDK